MQPQYTYRCRLHRVVDGDTFILDVDLGFHVHTHVTVRLRGIDCPELETTAGKAAALAAAHYLTEPNVVMQSYKDQQSFARWVCDVWVGDVLLAELLRAEGHVKPTVTVEHG